MQRHKAIVEKISGQEAYLAFEDGTRICLPLSKLPPGISEGTFLRISISVDRIAALLHKAGKREWVFKGLKS